ncbi:hypothetical protein PV325_012813, partial [Microctonus aethiopoides]
DTVEIASLCTSPISPLNYAIRKQQNFSLSGSPPHLSALLFGQGLILTPRNTHHTSVQLDATVESAVQNYGVFPVIIDPYVYLIRAYDVHIEISFGLFLLPA